MSSVSHRGFTHLGLDVAKDSIAVAVLAPDRDRAPVEKIFRPAGVVGRSRLGSATRVDAVSVHRAGVPGWMFLLLWNTFSGSYLAFTSASRRYVSSP